MTTATPLPLPRPSPPDERLKDLDCIGFVYRLPASEREPWLAWMQEIRRIDVLSERSPEAFEVLRSFVKAGVADGYYRGPQVAEWAAYIEALATYGNGYVLRTLADHDRMLCELSGHVMRCAPGMPEELWDAAYAFGALDQFYNNLRDLDEDRRRGLCWLPEEVLRRGHVTRRDVLTGRAPERPLWRALMRYWINDHGAAMLDGARQLLDAPGLPAEIDAMIVWTMDRYSRVRRTMAAVDYDYRRFPDVYWGEVRRELGKVEASWTE